MQENPELEICIPRETIIKKLNVSTQNKYEDNETIEARLLLKNKTEEEKSKRDLDSKLASDSYNSARMVDQIELEEEEIVEEINKETILEENKHQLDDIYYLDANNSQLNEECNQTNSSIDQFKYKNSNKQEPIKQLKNQKPSNLEQHSHQSQVNFHHFSEDDENDNEDGLDDDLADQVISTTTITSFVVNKQTNHQSERKQ